ncbi:XkdX family protein [Fructilactobacillus myrtifloralis]|uniref:XkdX family protein n=1 Tax=Fructilactobacillus myrtifloralis TaxID=2940301 RepID=A0ABY5BN37_9LACO|nr:XkdX family protein [Fructilactobacillus myrtifloralis]USS85092.1 XkdX family protein [Fructilactobacillus myrtifloralis]
MVMEIKTLRDQLKVIYDWGLYTDQEIAAHVKDGSITKADFKFITGKSYDKFMSEMNEDE